MYNRPVNLENPLDSISGEVHKAVFRGQDGYAIIALRLDSGEEATVCGPIGHLNEGAPALCLGGWQNHPTYGRQFKAESAKQGDPTTGRGVIKYLSSDFVDGIGPVMAKRIVAHFGQQSLRIIKTEPQRLVEVPGIGAKRAQALADAIHHHVIIEAIMVWLFEHGVSQALAHRIYERYGNNAVTILTENPYILAQEMFGVGFKTADNIGKAAGIPANAQVRLLAGIDYLLSSAQSAGHTAITRAQIEDEGTKLLGPIDLSDALLFSERTETLKRIPASPHAPEYLQHPRLFNQERAIGFGTARRNASLLSWPTSIEAKFNTAQGRAGIMLDVSQRQAVLELASARLGVLTGRPGTGKTTTLRVLLRLLEELGQDVLLASPTGKAARRLGEATGREAATIHRTLKVDSQNGGFLHNRNNPLDCTTLIVDEASMIDTFLMSAITGALPDTAQLILVGDTNQLPSVGPGAVLGDIIASGAANVQRLTNIHRQARASAIVTNAHAIIEGRYQDIADGSDFRFIPFEPGRLASRLPVFVAETLPAKLGVAPDDIQVLTAIHRGTVGTRTLNPALREKLNPNPSLTCEYRGTTFGVGDKVIVTRNNYDLGVYNGTLGRITDICRLPQPSGVPADAFMVNTEDNLPVAFIGTDRNDLAPAWCLSVHKFQGSQAPVVVLPLDMSQYMLLDRNWLYTAITRAQKQCVVLGSRKALATAVKTERTSKRQTLLVDRILSRF